MKAASVKEIKTAVEQLTNDELTEYLLRLSRFKKENKELLTYLLFEEQDEVSYVLSVKNEIDLAFESLNKSTFFLAKKTVRKAVRIALKYIKYSSKETTAVEILICVCVKIKESGLDLKRSPTLKNIYLAQLKKINAALEKMHEDLQYDYKNDVELLRNYIN
jgi:hypothetical protein